VRREQPRTLPQLQGGSRAVRDQHAVGTTPPPPPRPPRVSQELQTARATALGLRPHLTEVAEQLERAVVKDAWLAVREAQGADTVAAA